MKTLYILKRFNNINTWNKLLISYVLVVFLPVLSVGLILTAGMRQMALDRAINEASVNVDRVYNRINEVLKVPINISNRTHIDRSLQSILQQEYGSVWDVVKAYDEYKEFTAYINFYKEIDAIKFYFYNSTMLDSGQFVKITKDTSESAWFKKALSLKGQIYWQYIYDTMKDNYSLCLTNLVKDMYSGKPLGVLVVNVKTEYLCAMLKNEPYEIMVISDTGYIVAAKDISLIGKKADDIGLVSVPQMNAGIDEVDYKGKLSKRIVKTFVPCENNESFKIISVFPIKAIEGQTRNVSLLGFSMIAASLLLALVLIFIFSNAISKRVRNLSMDMHKVAMGNFDFSPTIEGEDEIGQLSRDLDTMVKSIKGLVHEVYEVNLQKNQLAIRQREIKLKMLANQINPHFLFNALETIRMKAHCKGEKEIAEVVKLLGKIMRRNLEIGSEMVTLESEIELVKSYLEIQKFRYGDRISYEINFDNEIRDYKILPLIIQPIVENAVVHGVESSQGGIGFIKIDLTRSENILKITVEDDGAGMDWDRLQYVMGTLEEADDTPGKRIGLKNVYQRIKLCYGEAYGLVIYSEKDKGTKIEIILPGKW